MIASKLISSEIIPLKTSDTGLIALDLMGDYGIKHLPIVNDVELLGIISEDNILDEDENNPIGSYSIAPNRISVSANMHLFNIMSYLAQLNLSLVPVINNENTYLGSITQYGLLHHFASSYTFTENGSILVLEMNQIDYSMAEISRIVESEDALILSSFIHSDYESPKVFVTLKINRENPGAIIASLERFDITVSNIYSKSDYNRSLKDRYDSLMNYLSV